MKKFIFSLILTALPLGAIAGDLPDRADADASLRLLYNKAAEAGIGSLSRAEKVKWFAEFFNNKERPFPYLIDPLGEGSTGEFDKDPLYRFDGFDCTTFIETVLALSLSSSPEDFRHKMNLIRYKDGRITYESRNHFTSLEWIPNNISQGFLKDATANVALTKTKLAQTYIEKDQWYTFKGEMFSAAARREAKHWAAIRYVSKEDLLNDSELLERIPSGSIFNVVRPNWQLKAAIGTNLDVSHQGILIRENGVVYMIHASNGASRDGSDNQKRVKKDVLTEYVRDVMMKSSTMGGMNILSVP